jgi:quinol monooxygenase YgiN
MNDSVFIMVGLEVTPGKSNEVKAIINHMVDRVRETEPHTLRCSYFENEKGTEIRIIEQYTSVEAVFAHNENVNEYVLQLESMVTFTKAIIFGNVDLSALSASDHELFARLYGEVWIPFAAAK